MEPMHVEPPVATAPRHGVVRRVWLLAVACLLFVAAASSARALQPGFSQLRAFTGPLQHAIGRSRDDTRTGLRSSQYMTPSDVAQIHEGQTDLVVEADGERSGSLSRRSALGLGAAAAAIGLVASAPEVRAEPSDIKMYFGAGCFWHVQHEFVGEEQAVLNRKPNEITAVSGYAGGTQVGPGNKVCYHNPQGIADYGRLGHTEVVQVQIPESAVPSFTKKYFDLFGKQGMRHDPQDMGGEYRYAIGLPGGEASPHFKSIKQAADASPGKMKLVSGKGDEGDTIFAKEVLVYDSEKFPFYPGEVYHQFHDDFMGPPYGRAYNGLQRTASDAGTIQRTGCPEFRGR